MLKALHYGHRKSALTRSTSTRLCSWISFLILSVISLSRSHHFLASNVLSVYIYILKKWRRGMWNEHLVGLGYRKGSSNVGAPAIFWRRKRNKHTQPFLQRACQFDGDFSSLRQPMAVQSPNVDSNQAFKEVSKNVFWIIPET